MKATLVFRLPTSVAKNENVNAPLLVTCLPICVWAMLSLERFIQEMPRTKSRVQYIMWDAGCFSKRLGEGAENHLMPLLYESHVAAV